MFILNRNIKQKRSQILFILVFISFGLVAINTYPNEYRVDVIVIDPGHGGKDPGAKGKKSKEKDIVLNIGLLLGKYIEENLPDVKVVYTRTTDKFIPLYKRAEIANNNKADLFISIHANSNPSPAPFGASSHVLGLHRFDENFEVAKRENSVILIEEDYKIRYENFDPNSSESYIIFSMMQNAYDEQSLQFATLVQNQFRERVNRKDRGVIRQGLLVLAQTAMPGLLIETGFITNPREEAFLLSNQGQEYIASAIFRAVREYKESYEKMNVPPVMALNSESSSNTGVSAPELKESPVEYKIQIYSSHRSINLNNKHFKDYEGIKEIKYNNLYKYAIGSEYDYEKIIELKRTVQQDFPDAFIIALKNDTIIPLQQALKEKANK
ncbi:N-acetylmuramoyl-L-alanine amidase [Bacteroidota bacterium]